MVKGCGLCFFMCSVIVRSIIAKRIVIGFLRNLSLFMSQTIDVCAQTKIDIVVGLNQMILLNVNYGYFKCWHGANCERWQSFDSIVSVGKLNPSCCHLCQILENIK